MPFLKSLLVAAAAVLLNKGPSPKESSASENQVCPSSWIYHSHSHSCMRLYKDPRHFKFANSYCNTVYKNWKGNFKDKFSHLVYILDEDTDKFVKELLREASADKAFIGLHEHRGQYIWGSHPNSQVPTYLGWREGEPNHKSKHHVVVTQKGWETHSERRRTSYVCQVDAEFPRPKLTCPAQEEGKRSSEITCTLPDLDLTKLSAIEISRSQIAVVSCYGQQSCRTSTGYQAPETLITSRGETKLSVNITSVSRSDEGTWACVYKLKDNNEIVASTCEMSVYAAPQDPVCTYRFKSGGGKIEVTCISDKVYPQGKCEWTYAINQQNPKAVSGQKLMNEERYIGDDLYYNTTCTMELKLSSLGFYSFRVSIYPDLSGTDRNQKPGVISGGVNVTVVLPTESPVISLVEGGQHTPVSSIETSVGDTVTIECTVGGGTPPLMLTTLRCENAIQDVRGGSIKREYGHSVSMTVQITKQMNRRFCGCEGRHALGQYKKRSNVTFSVKYPAQIISFKASSQNSRPGDTVSFTCKAGGHPAAEIKLFRVGSSGQFTLLHHMHGPVLTYQQEATCLSSARYRCVARNTENLQDDTKEIQRNIKCPPEHCDTSDVNPIFAVPALKDVTIRICVVAYPEPTTFTLYKGSTGKLRVDSSATFSYTHVSIARGQIELTIKELQKEDLGEFRLYTADRKRQANGYLRFRLTTQGPPECPLDLAVTVVYSDAITLSWTPGYDGGFTQTFIILRHDLNDLTSDISPKVLTMAKVIDSKERSMLYNITGLTANTTYSFSLKVENSAGQRQCSHLSVQVFTDGPPSGEVTEEDGRINKTTIIVLVSVIAVLASIFLFALVTFCLWRCHRKSVQPPHSDKVRTNEESEVPYSQPMVNSTNVCRATTRTMPYYSQARSDDPVTAGYSQVTDSVRNPGNQYKQKIPFYIEILPDDDTPVTSPYTNKPVTDCKTQTSAAGTGCTEAEYACVGTASMDEHLYATPGDAKSYRPGLSSK